MRKILVLLAVLASPLHAQQATSASGGVLRALDKVSGAAHDIEMRRGQTARVGNLDVLMTDCRFPKGNPAGDAYVELEINTTGRDDKLFSGWMIASSPALSALEHPRYDIWAIRCTTS